MEYCKHCWPTKRKHHWYLHFDYYFNKLANIILTPLTFFWPKRFKQNKVWPFVIESLAFFKIIQLVDQPDETQIYNRSLIFFKEAQKRGIDIKIVKCFNNYTNDFKFRYNQKSYYYEGIPLIMKDIDSSLDNKYYIKKLLDKHNLPIAKGKSFFSIKQAVDYAKQLSFPLVVKPNAGSLSHHITCNINTQEELKKAIQLAKQYTPEFIVERYIPGNLYRITIVNQQYAFACQKDKANIVGDGKSTIQELIDQKNSHQLRGSLHQKNTTLHEIQIDDVLINNLAQDNLSLGAILPLGRKQYLQDKFVLSHGCDIINITDQVHQDNQELFLRVATILKTDLVGIDFICPDISQSYHKQTTAIIETNSLPYIDMHQYPSHGVSESIAVLVWDIILAKLNN